jgi:hypothetical protein
MINWLNLLRQTDTKRNSSATTQTSSRIRCLARLRSPDYAAIQDADIVLVGTWVHGLFVVGQTPWALATISNLPAMRGKRAAVFLTFALNAGKSLERLSGAVSATGADVIGGLEIKRHFLEQHTEEFVNRLIGAVETA